jgi:1-phosphofructokinase
MIHTVTFNPSLDYIVHADKVDIGGVNRSLREDIFFGGKGINVSFVLNELGIASRAMGFVAGFTGAAIAEGVAKRGIETDFVVLSDGLSRINVKVRAGNETEINGRGPEIDEESLNLFYTKLDSVSDGDILVLAGSIPPSLPSDIYERTLERVSNKNVKTVVDTSGDMLLGTLKYKPYLIKPNKDELGELFGVDISSHDEVVHYASKLKDMGAENVLVSMASEGAYLLDENRKHHKTQACNGKMISSIGAGDSMVAGFIAGLVDGDFEHALKLGTAAGSATAFSYSLAERDDIYRLFNEL